MKFIFRTPLCDLLGIEYPIVQSGMGIVAGAALAVAVSDAGGLGIIGGAVMEIDELRTAIREVKARTGRAFGVNLLPHDLCPPVSSQDITDETITAGQSALNPLREKLGLPSVTSPPLAPADTVPEKSR